MEEVSITLDEVNSKKAADFFRIYEYESHINTSNLNGDIYIGDKNNRVCRFCNKTKPEVTFKKKAHLIPQFLGNRYLLSGFECDTCNKTFGELYEDSFANYLGAYRPFAFLKTSKNKKYPKHKETGILEDEVKLKLSIQQTEPKNVEIVFEHPFNNSIEFNKENKKVTINATRKPYIPIYVYKMLLKIGLSMIKSEEVINFKNTIAFLKDNSQNDKLKDFGLCHVYMHSIYGPTMFGSPTIYLYRKKHELENELYPSKTFIIYTANHIYQIYIPFNEKDNQLIGKKITVLPYPLLFDESLYKNGLSYKSYGELMTGHEKVYNEEQKLVFSYDNVKFQNGEENGSS